jgi:hypothetical protein
MFTLDKSECRVKARSSPGKYVFRKGRGNLLESSTFPAFHNAFPANLVP